jgi:hypothetical protein
MLNLFTVTAEGEPKLTTRLLEPVEPGATPPESTDAVKWGIVVGTATSALNERHFLSSCGKPATERSWLGFHLNLGPAPVVTPRNAPWGRRRRVTRLPRSRRLAVQARSTTRSPAFPGAGHAPPVHGDASRALGMLPAWRPLIVCLPITAPLSHRQRLHSPMCFRLARRAPF